MTSRKRFCFACDLKDDPELIKRYKEYHLPGNVWPEVLESLREAGVVDMEIYLTGNRMYMVMEVDDTFDVQRKAEMDARNPKVQEWEELMWEFQQAVPWADEGQKWVPMERVFRL